MRVRDDPARVEAQQLVEGAELGVVGGHLAEPGADDVVAVVAVGEGG